MTHCICGGVQADFFYGACEISVLQNPVMILKKAGKCAIMRTKRGRVRPPPVCVFGKELLIWILRR